MAIVIPIAILLQSTMKTRLQRKAEEALKGNLKKNGTARQTLRGSTNNKKMKSSRKQSRNIKSTIKSNIKDTKRLTKQERKPVSLKGSTKRLSKKHPKTATSSRSAKSPSTTPKANAQTQSQSPKEHRLPKSNGSSSASVSLKSVKLRQKHGIEIIGSKAKKCNISGIAVSHDGKVYVTERAYSSLRTFSPEMTRLSETNWPHNLHVCGVTVFSSNEVVLYVTTANGQHQMWFLNFTATTLMFGSILNLEHCIAGLTSCLGNIYLTCPSQSYVRKMDKSGKIYWCTSRVKKAKANFTEPNHIASFITNSAVKLVVSNQTEESGNTLTLLDGGTGDILAVYTAADYIGGITIGPFNNIFISYPSFHDGAVSVLSSDLSDERVLLTSNMQQRDYPHACAHDLQKYPGFIAYNKISNCLLVTRCTSESKSIIQVYEFCEKI